MIPFSVYLHIPYCLHKCPYCDFNTYAVSSFPERDYVAALMAELDYRMSLPEWKGRKVRTIYFGGGTPSLFSPDSIATIISTIKKLCGFTTADIEISLEANPGSVEAEKFLGYWKAGVNRLSFGAQSFSLSTLQKLGRLHTPDQVAAAVAAAKSAGFKNLSLDLMFGVPDQTLADVRSDLQQVVRLDPSHVSVYGLTIEKGTPFYQSYKRGDFSLPDEDALIAMTEEINSFLASCGYQRYEISNYALQGRAARHNLAYWNAEDYLGLGAGAHSYTSLYDSAEAKGVRWSNFALPKKYITEASAHGRADSWQETLEKAGLIFEFFFLGLRKIEGVRFSVFESRFGASIFRYYPTLMKVLVSQKLLQINDDFLSLTPQGLLLADSVIENFSQIESLPTDESAARA